MDALVEKPSNCYGYFFRLSGISDIPGKVFLSSNLISQKCFMRVMQVKQFIFFSFVSTEIDRL